MDIPKDVMKMVLQTQFQEEEKAVSILNLGLIIHQTQTMSYCLIMYNNFDSFDEDGITTTTKLNSIEEAIQKAKGIVKEEVISVWAQGTNIEKLTTSWLSYGTHIDIKSDNPTEQVLMFSSKNCAKETIDEMKHTILHDKADIQTAYQKTILFAAEKHALKNQVLPDTNIPYVVHLSNVCMEIFMAHQQKQDFNLKLAVQVALLHDVLEDTETTEQELEGTFGIVISNCIKALSKNETLAKEQQMINSLERIKKMPKETGAVKLADRITNLQAPPKHWSSEKIRSYHDQAKLIYKELRRSNQFLASRLKLAIKNYEEYLK